MSPPNPLLSLPEAAVFGNDAVRHPAGFVVEQGSGSLPVQQQLENHIRTVAQTEGSAAANAIRRQFGLPIPEEVAAAKAEADRARAEREKAAYLALEEKDAAADAKARETSGPLASSSALH
jgi:hypothetical protein